MASRDGDQASFAQIVRRYQSLACAVTYSATGDRAASEDLAQDAFIVAWQRLSEMEEPDRFRPWLCGIARNLARNARRKARHEVATSDLSKRDAEELHADDVLDERQRQARVWNALEEIPETYREPLVLFYREGQSTKEVAAALGLSTSAVEQRLSRGRKQLRHEMRDLVTESLGRIPAPAAGFAAAVMASIAALPAHAADGEGAGEPDASPEAGAGGAAVAGAQVVASSSVLVPGLAVAALVGVGLAAVLMTQREDEALVAPPSAAAVMSPDDEAPSTRSASGSREADARVQRDRERARQRASAPSRPRVEGYVLTRITDRKVSVNLGGGQSNLTTLGPPDNDPPPTVRTWRGRVVDEQGEPVAGAVVLAGSRLQKILGDSVTAAAGATSGPDGSFSVALLDEGALVAVALASSAAWSPRVMLPAGREDLQRDLVVSVPATMRGTLTRGGDPVVGQLTVTDDGGTNLRFSTGADGRYEIPELPPGEYTVMVSDAANFGDSGGAVIRRTAVLQPATTTQLDVDIAVGALVAFDVEPPDDEPLSTLTFFVVDGHHDIADRDALDALIATLPPGASRYILHGGSDLDDPAQFRDLPEGETTTCIHGQAQRDERLEGVKGWRGRSREVYFECRQIEVAPPGGVTPVLFAWD